MSSAGLLVFGRTAHVLQSASGAGPSDRMYKPLALLPSHTATTAITTTTTILLTTTITVEIVIVSSLRDCLIHLIVSTATWCAELSVMKRTFTLSSVSTVAPA